MRPDRRKFLRDSLCASLGGVSMYSALGNLQLLQAASLAGSSYAFSDYKALVCVFLYGGNDSFNMVMPYTQTAYDTFFASAGTRPQLAIDRATLNPLNDPGGTSKDGIQYALHPQMPELASLFNKPTGSPVAIMANVGTLIGPVTQAEYQSDNQPDLPPQLFSHSDQSSYWQSSPPSNQPTTGWGGRIADLVAAANPSGIPILTGLNGQDVFIRGQDVNGYIMNSSGASTLNSPGSQSRAVFDALRASNSQANALERTYAATMNHSIATANIINTAVDSVDFSSFFPGADGDLDTQLQTVAQLIYAAVKNNLAGYTGIKRQVFFVTTGGYDTHSDELATHGITGNPGILSLLSKSLAGFYNALQSVSMAGNATAFTASDFGRTMTTNDGGTDHGWGSHHFVVGGAVKGNKFYGNGCGFSGQAANYGLVMPSLLAPNGDSPTANLNDSGDGYGRILPTTSVDQYSATLANWFLSGGGGTPASDINLIFPNLNRFSASASYNPTNGFLGILS